MQNGKICFVHAPAREMAGVVRHSPAVAEWTIRSLDTSSSSSEAHSRREVGKGGHQHWIASL